MPTVPKCCKEKNAPKGGVFSYERYFAEKTYSEKSDQGPIKGCSLRFGKTYRQRREMAEENYQQGGAATLGFYLWA